MYWLSINQLQRLTKQWLYRIENGSRPSDHLTYDAKSKEYTGHIEQGSKHQVGYKGFPLYKVQHQDSFDNDWEHLKGGGW